ncbi:hypothetical protein [Streptomyces sp. NPDC057694]|uniref:hypothetical protein n=1 Tax=Streptomyces sp. NPDC057694 TaxID=3346216 RepID=UPI0036BC346A
MVGGTGDGSRAAGQQARRPRAAGWAGLLLALVSGVLFALVPLADQDNRAYAAAQPCPAGVRSDTCTTAAAATVTDKDSERSGKSTHYFLTVRDSGSRATAGHRVRMTTHGRVYDVVGPGDRVTVVYWKGDIRAVRYGGSTQQTWTSPAHDGRLPGAFAVLTGAVAFGLLWLWWWQRYRPTPRGAPHSWETFTGLVAGILVACLALPLVLMGDSAEEGLQIVGLGAVLALPLSAALCRWSVRRVRRGIAKIVPALAAGRRVLPAAVHGDVPYDRPGYCYLVVGDGPLVATPDPTGHVALAPLPDTLAVRRVREHLTGDPAFSTGRRGESVVVIECVDGDRTVLVLAGRKDTPQILGALLEEGPGWVTPIGPSA